MDRADDICIACGGQFAERFLLWVEGPKRPPMCKDCARVNSGLRGHKTIPKLAARRYRRLREELEQDLANRGTDDVPLVPLTEPSSPPDDDQERQRGRLLRLPSRSVELEVEPGPDDDLADVMFDSFLDQTGGRATDPPPDPTPLPTPEPRESIRGPQGEAAEQLARIRASGGPSELRAESEPPEPATWRPEFDSYVTAPATPAQPPVPGPATPSAETRPSVPQAGEGWRRPGFVFSDPRPDKPPAPPTPATTASAPSPPDAAVEDPVEDVAPLPRRRAPRAEIPEFRPAPTDAFSAPSVPTLPTRRRNEAEHAPDPPSAPPLPTPASATVDEDGFAARLLDELDDEPAPDARLDPGLEPPAPTDDPGEARPDQPGFVDMTLGGEALALWDQIRDGTLLPPKEEEPDPWADVPEALRPKT